VNHYVPYSAGTRSRKASLGICSLPGEKRARLSDTKKPGQTPPGRDTVLTLDTGNGNAATAFGGSTGGGAETESEWTRPSFFTVATATLQSRFERAAEDAVGTLGESIVSPTSTLMGLSVFPRQVDPPFYRTGATGSTLPEPI
jgi:hypothetical protein